MEDSVVGQGRQVGQREEPRKTSWRGLGMHFWLISRWANINGDRAGRTRKHILPSELPGLGERNPELQCRKGIPFPDYGKF